MVALAFACLYVWGGRPASSARPVSHAPSAAQQLEGHEQAARGDAQVHLHVNGDSAHATGADASTHGAVDDGGEGDVNADAMAALAAAADADASSSDGGSDDASSSDGGSDDGDLSAFLAAAEQASADEQGGADEESFLASAAAAEAAGDEDKEKKEGGGGKKAAAAGGGKKDDKKAAEKKDKAGGSQEGQQAEDEDEPPAVDLAGKMNRQATLRMMLRANASPFRKCSGIKNIQFALSDQQVRACCACLCLSAWCVRGHAGARGLLPLCQPALLFWAPLRLIPHRLSIIATTACVLACLQALQVLANSTERWGEVQWAEVTDVPCRKDDGSPGCCSRRFSFRYGSTDYLVFQQVCGLRWAGGALNGGCSRWGGALPILLYTAPECYAAAYERASPERAGHCMRRPAPAACSGQQQPG